MIRHVIGVESARCRVMKGILIGIIATIAFFIAMELLWALSFGVAPCGSFPGDLCIEERMIK